MSDEALNLGFFLREKDGAVTQITRDKVLELAPGIPLLGIPERGHLAANTKHGEVKIDLAGVIRWYTKTSVLIDHFTSGSSIGKFLLVVDMREAGADEYTIKLRFNEYSGH